MEKILLEHTWIIIIILFWTLPWKAAALWRSARRGHIGWFLTILLLNTLGILDILYIFVFGKMLDKKKQLEIEEQQRKIDSQPRKPRFAVEVPNKNITI